MSRGFSWRGSVLYLLIRILHACSKRNLQQPLNSASVKRLLVVSTTALGDAVLSTPAMRSLRQGHPQAHITLLVQAAYAALFTHHPDIDQLMTSQRGWRGFFRLAWKLKRQNFDLICLLHGNEPQATPLAYLSGARWIYKLPNTSAFRFLLSNPSPTQDWEHFQHGIDQRLAVAALAGGAPTHKTLCLTIPDENKQQVEKWLQAQQVDPKTTIIAFQPGASTTIRRWPAEHFIALGQQLLATYPEAYLLLTGAPAEKALIQSIINGISSARVLHSESLGLALLPAMLSRCQLLVTGDTGPLHVAVAVGTPTVALFAFSDHRRSGPLDLAQHHVIQKWRTCDPCWSKACPYNPPICIENIHVAEVATAVQQQLNRNAKLSIEVAVKNPVEKPNTPMRQNNQAGLFQPDIERIPFILSTDQSPEDRSSRTARGDDDVVEINGIRSSHTTEQAPIRLWIFDTGCEYGGGTKSLIELLKRIDRSRFQITAAFCHNYRCGEQPIEVELSALQIPFRLLAPQRQPLWAKWAKELTRLLLFAFARGRRRFIETIDYRWRILPLAKRLSELLSREQVALLYLNNQPSSNLAGYLAAEIAGIPAVQHCRRDVPLSHRDIAAVNRIAQSVICVSNDLQQSLQKQGVDAKKCVVVPNGIDIDQPLPVPRQLPRSQPPARVVIGTVSRLVTHKFNDHILQALALINRLGYRDWQYVLVGDGPEQPRLKRIAAQLGLTDRLIWAGFQTDPLAWAATFDIFVLASKSEGFGRATLEAMWLGKPVIASCVSGSRELVVENETGFLYPFGSISVLSEQLAVLIQDTALRQRLGLAGRKRVEQRYAIGTSVQRIEHQLLAAL